MKKTSASLLLAMLLCIASTFAYAQERRIITGTVRDSLGSPQAGVSIKVKGSQTATASDEKGHFKILASSQNILVFSAVGYTTQEVKVNQSRDLSVSLQSSVSYLEDVVVTSMGIKRQSRSLGYAVSSVSAKDITESGSTNFAAALYGKAAGVKIASAPGGASSAVTVQIRGVSSINLNTQPLYVVDGVPIRLYNDLVGNLGNGSNNGGYWGNQRIQGNGVLDINPEDIESLTILKGASASALYGSEATNGVVVITTKKGIKGKGLGVDFNYLATMEKVAYGPDYQNDYGPGYDAQTNVGNGIATAEGWSTADSYHHLLEGLCQLWA